MLLDALKEPREEPKCDHCVLRFSLVSRTNNSHVNLGRLYDAHELFALRDAAGTTLVPALYQGVIAAAFHDHRAQKLLGSVIHVAPRSSEAKEAREWLETVHFRAGRYPKTAADLDDALAIDPNDADAKGLRALIAAFPQKQSRARSRSSELHYRKTADGLFIPVSINGRPGNYAIDSDSNISTLAESEAKRLGLAVRDVSPDAAKGRGAIGAPFGYRVAVADDLVVGDFPLRHVAFLILRDDQQPLADLPPGERGILGLPILLAFQTVRWSSDGTFDIGFPSAHRDIRKSNICFDELDVITQVTFEQHKLGFILDTGSDNTDLWPSFAKEFATFVDKTGKKTSWRTTGFDGSETLPGVAIPEIRLRAGGFEATLRPGRVMLKQPGSNPSYYGRLGMTFLNQAHRVTLDFKAMTLTVE
jgi:hypothetical protein